MIEVKLVYRYNLSGLVVSTIDELIISPNTFNLISTDRIKKYLLNTDNELVKEINSFINSGKVVPDELYYLIWDELMVKGKLNVFASMVGNLEKFKILEQYIKINGYCLTEVIYLKIKNTDKLIELASSVYSKMYSDSNVLKKYLENYDKQITQIIEYAESNFRVVIKDFFDTDIIV